MTPASPEKLDVDEEQWLRLVAMRNRRWLRHLSWGPSLNARLALSLRLGRGRRWIRHSPALGWKASVLVGGTAEMFKRYRLRADHDALTAHFGRHIDSGRWSTPIEAAPHLMKLLWAYDLSELVEGGTTWRAAAVDATRRFLENVDEPSAEGFAYSPEHGVILADVLAMVPPVLARYATVEGDARMADMAVQHLLAFARENVDMETGLPFHGFYPGGPHRLGMLGWGRGVGWYLLGMALTLPHVPAGAGREEILGVFRSGVEAACRYQSSDGSWPDALLHRRGTRPDTSATGMIGWAIALGLKEGHLGEWVGPVLTRACNAIRERTDRMGRVREASGECGGLGRYSAESGHHPWGQGATLALAASVVR